MDIVDYEEPTEKIVFSDHGVDWYGEMEEKPEIEKSLFRLQHEYYNPKNPDKTKTWSEMLEVCQSYARSLILKRIKGHNYVEPDIVWDKATNAALQFMCQYINRPGFHTGASFAGMLQWKVVEALYKDWPEESHLSLNSLIGDSKNDLESMQDSANLESVFGNNYSNPGDFVNDSDLQEVIHELLQDFDEGVEKDEKYGLLSRIYLLISLKKPKNKHSKGMFLKRWAGDYKTKKLLDKMMLEFRTRLEDSTRLY